MISLKRILVPTDFSEPGKSALQYAVAFADQFGSAVHLLHVVEPVPSGALMSHISKEELHRDMVEQAKKQMEELHTEWQDYSFPVTQSVLDGHAFVEIIKYARENDIDLIVMGTHGRGAVSHMFIGSVAEKTVRKAPCPVLTISHPEHEFVHP